MAEAINLTGVVLAGGLSRRMEGPEKSLLTLQGKTLIERVVERLVSQVSSLIINANGEPERFQQLGFPICEDTVEGYAGPLAGILTAMQWCKSNQPTTTHILTAAADTPFFPADLATRFLEAKGQPDEKTICLATSDNNRHPTFGIWPVGLADALHHFLVKEEERKIMLFAKRYDLVMVDFPISDSMDPFFNINTPQDLQTAQAWLER